MPSSDRGPRLSLTRRRRADLARKLGAWFDQQRRDLPWRRTRDPYAIWLSEVMLQQTRVKTVEDYFSRFLRAYPTVEHLARADLADVLGAWSGLGYYRRARALYAGAREIVETYGGKVPSDAASLRGISGIGPYTAGAIASIAFGAREAVVDGNVARVLSRVFALRCDVKTPAGSRQLWTIAGELVPEDTPGRHNEALMELGATVCLPRAPRCDACPLEGLCRARAEGVEAVLPIGKRKKAPLHVDMLALITRRGARVLLARRRPGGLFGGLWEPPMVEIGGAKNAEAALGALLGVERLELSPVAEQTHVLTHRRFRITIATADIAGESLAAASTPYDRLAWKPSAELGSLAMSSLARKVLLGCPG